jgi:hypothetical protein
VARQRKPKLTGTGADMTISGTEMTVEPVPLWDQKHTVIGYLPMIKCLNAYGTMTMVAPALVELEDYFNGSIDAGYLASFGLDTPEGAMEAWENCGIVAKLPPQTTADKFIAGAVLEGGYMRSLAKADAPALPATFREADNGESEHDDGWVLEEYDLEDLATADAGLPEGETWMEA